MPRTGPRPHCWKVQGDIPHKQYLAFLQMRAQANYRNETFELLFEEYQDAWKSKWDMKGRGADDYCLTRIDATQAWAKNNVECIPRRQHLINSGKIKKEKGIWQTPKTD